MIKKLSTIKNIYSFVDYCASDYFYEIKKSGKKSEVEFGKMSIIFGDNGSGKTAIGKIFRSLNGENISLEKNWKYEKKNQEIKILTAQEDIYFDGNNWNSTELEDRIVVFDKDFIKDNIHVMGNREAKHDKSTGKLMVRLGKFYELTKFLDFLVNLGKEIENCNQSLKGEAEKRLANICSKYSLNPEEFKKNLNKVISTKETKEDLEEKVNQLSKRLEKLGRSRDKINEIKNLKELELIILPLKYPLHVKIKLKDVLKFSIAENVKQTLNLISDKEEFIKEGLDILKKTDDKICPFCNQKIVDEEGHYLEVVKNYKNIFNIEFEKNLQKNNDYLKTLQKEIEQVEKLEYSFLKEDSKNNDKFKQFEEFYPNEIKYPSNLLSFYDEEKKVIKQLKKKIDKKIKNNLMKISIDDETVEEFTILTDRIKKNLELYNKKVSTINKEIVKIKKQDEVSINKTINRIYEEHSLLRLKVFYLENKKEIDKYLHILDNYKNNQEVLSRIKKIQDEAEVKIETKFQKFTETYFEKVKKYMNKVDPTFSLEIQGKGKYDRRYLESTIATFEIGFKDNKIGLDSLSEGEKQTISVSYFLSLLENEDNNKIIVLDDPITNFDAGKRKIVAELIRDVMSRFKQVFIFTCDPLFERYCKSVINNAKLFWILKNNYKCGGSFLFPVSRENLINELENDLGEIVKNGPKTLGEMITAGQKLRYCVEITVKDIIFMHSVDKVNEILERIKKNPDKISDFVKDSNKVTTLIDIYRFCDLGGALHFDKSNISSWNEMKLYIQKYLNLGV